jgi:type IV pilus assembly protein PilF
MHREIGDVPTALDRLDQAIEVQDDFAPARVDRAVLFARSGDAARAEAEFLAALDSNPYYPKAQFNYGAFLVENGRLDEAIPLFDRAVALAPTYLNARAAQVTAHALAGDLDAARAALQPLERMAPDAAEVVELRRWVESL